jgi:KTSC domain
MDDQDQIPPVNPPDLTQEIVNTVQAGANAVENTAAARIGAIQMVSVQSSDIAAWGYDPVEFQLQIQFTNDRIYVYESISPMDFEMLSNAPSKGKAFWALIRRNPVGHPFTRIS